MNDEDKAKFEKLFENALKTDKEEAVLLRALSGDIKKEMQE